MRMLAIYHKGTELAFTSHLDIQSALQRALRRANIPLAFSQGFNPHPKMSFASAVATGQTSDAEWFEVTLREPVTPDAFVSRVNVVMPKGFYLSDAVAVADTFPSLSSLTRAAEYAICIRLSKTLSEEAVREGLDSLLSGAIIINKKTKSGYKDVDIRPDILGVTVERIEEDRLFLRVLGRLQADGGLRADAFCRALLDRLAAQGVPTIRRTQMYFAGDGPLPQLP